jgi:hypothetical protein
MEAPMACNTCGQEQFDGYCHNKQCSRHGRRNDYMADVLPEPIIAATEEHPAIYRDGKRLVAGKRYTLAMLDAPNTGENNG